MKFVILIILSIYLAACTSVIRFTNNSTVATTPGKVFRGYASYYHDSFNGKKTANGEIFDNNLLTAAHKELPFNTVIKVKNLKNGKEVVLRINDRGPFVSGRILDVSRKAAIELDFIREGITEVEFEILE